MKGARLATALGFALALAGCAAPAPAPVVPAPPPAAPAAPAVTPRAPATGPAAAARDSSPTPEALAVLATIPEPLSPAETSAAAPGRGAARPPAATPVSEPALPRVLPAPVESFDSLRVETSGGDVPVPAPTQPLGSVNAPLAVTPPPVASPGSAPPPVAGPPAAAASPDTCWRVQVAAPADRAKGKALRDAAESLLMVPMIVDREGGRFKVRSRDCLSRAAAESLRDRATASGFRGVFLVHLAGRR